MKISWNIEKKRGHFRPILIYTVELEEFERELAVPRLNILSTIPKLDKPGQSHCLPGENERAEDWVPRDYHYISVPYFKEGYLRETLTLPFRESGLYPEVAQSFALLREKYEEIVRNAYSQQPLSQSGELDITPETKQAIAGALAARKMLAFCTP